MRAWKAVVLLNLGLAIGVGWGYAFWGLRVARLEQDLAVARAMAAAQPGVEREWTVEGVVRAIFPEINVLVITHGDIAGYMPPMTMGFRTAAPKIQEAVGVGDAVRFTIRGIPPNVAVVAIEKIAGP
jgi:Cu/Ag efflux protein CusF